MGTVWHLLWVPVRELDVPQKKMARSWVFPPAPATVTLQNVVIPEEGSVMRLRGWHGYVFCHRPAPGTVRACPSSG